jgi:hypothetical protein
MQISVRYLFAITLFFALASFLVMNAVRFRRGFATGGPITDTTAWPQQYVEIAEQLKIPFERIAVYGLPRFRDMRSVTKVEFDPNFVVALIDQQGLVPTDTRHPLAEQLQYCVPNGWNNPNFRTATWYTTPEFGESEIVNQDLFLVCTDSESGVSLILHNNVL